MSETVDALNEFVAYASRLSGDEKGEAQVFCDRLFQAFGHRGYKEAGATLEARIKKLDTKGASFADLMWPSRLLLEMKKRGEKPDRHYKQAFDYWIRTVPHRPRYVVICNFDEFWIYDFDRQLDAPVDKVMLSELTKRYTALNFLFSDEPAPIFDNDRVAVTQSAADKVAQVYNSLVENRKEDRARAQRFVLQLVVAMFAEDIDLLPSGTIHRIIEDCRKGYSSYDLFGGLLRQMNDPRPARAGRYKGVPYFNGGLFASTEPCELAGQELDWLGSAAVEDWSKVSPAIFGALFQQSMGKAARHAYGAHFTAEADILRIVDPTIVRPWTEKIEAVSKLGEFIQLRNEMTQFKVLDPACGSGNFLYVAYRELVRVELRLMEKVRESFSEASFLRDFKTSSLIKPHQFYGIDIDKFGVELAKVTLVLAKKLAIDDAVRLLGRRQFEIAYSEEEALPLDNLDANFICGDALFEKWPEADAIIGNPPYQSKNKMQEEFGRAYLNRVRRAYPDVPGHADYCVYWFRKTHEHLEKGQRAGLVGTKTIRQNYSRIGGLDYIVNNGGTITEAVAHEVWSGEAVVHVAVVNWIKGEQAGKKRLYKQLGDQRDSPWEMREIDRIGASLSYGFDVTAAIPLRANAADGGCYQGQTHGRDGFLLSLNDAAAEIRRDPKAAEVLFPYLIGDELLGEADSLPKRCVIDFRGLDMLAAAKHTSLFGRIRAEVLPAREAAAKREEERNKEALNDDPNASINWHHKNFLRSWWRLSYDRGPMIEAISKIACYIVCVRVTKRPVFEFINPAIRPGDALTVFPFADDYTFGVLQSDLHWLWFNERCSTLKREPRYTSDTVFDTFPWPQAPSAGDIAAVARAAVELRAIRRAQMVEHGLTLRELYRFLELPGAHPIKDAQGRLDAAVRLAYGMNQRADPLAFLFDLNQKLAADEASGTPIIGPGLPPHAVDSYVTADCVTMPDWPPAEASVT